MTAVQRLAGGLHAPTTAQPSRVASPTAGRSHQRTEHCREDRTGDRARGRGGQRGIACDTTQMAARDDAGGVQRAAGATGSDSGGGGGGGALAAERRLEAGPAHSELRGASSARRGGEGGPHPAAAGVVVAAPASCIARHGSTPPPDRPRARARRPSTTGTPRQQLQLVAWRAASAPAAAPTTLLAPPAPRAPATLHRSEPTSHGAEPRVPR